MSLRVRNAAKTVCDYGLFDIVLVDGRDRNNCIFNAITALKENGIIILDDGERKRYEKGIDRLTREGFLK